MPLPAETLQRLADDLYQAARQSKTVPKLTDRYPDLTLDDARAIGARVADAYRQAGHRQIGWKVALTNAEILAQVGLDGPVVGPIFDLHGHAAADPLRLGDLNEPFLEPEIGFLLGEDLVGPGVTIPRVLAATRGVFPTFEIVDSRQPWDFDPRNLIADNVYHARLVVGEMLVPPDGIDLRTVGMVLERNGAIVGTGVGANALGHPARAVAFLVNTLAARGDRLRAGQLVTTGTLMPPVRLAAGEVYTGFSGGLGRITLRVIA